MISLSNQKAVDQSRRVIRIFFRKEVAAFHRLTMCARSPLTPDAQRTSVFRVERIERTGLGPQMQHRALDSRRCLLIGAIVFDIDGRSGSILFADSVNPRRIAKSRKILIENLRTEGTLSEWVAKNRLRRAE